MPPLCRRITLAASLLACLALSAPGARADLIPVFVPGTSDPWLAGMPAGSTAGLDDKAPAQSPVLVPGLKLTPGEALTFQALGKAGNGNRPDQLDGPNGGPFTRHGAGAQNGIADYHVPINALVGAFLGDGRPDGSAAPPALDFRPGGNVPGGVNYLTLAPALDQVFFIGNGRTGAAQKHVIVPQGATRLYLGTADGFDWSNNVGGFLVFVDPPSPAPEPGALTLFGLGGLALAACAARRRRPWRSRAGVLD